MKIQTLGTYPLAQKTSYLLTFDKVQIILDAGGTEQNGTLRLPQQILQSLPLYIIITHCHTDHTASLPFLVEKLAPITIFSSILTKQMIAERGTSKQLKALSDQIQTIPFNIEYQLDEIISFLLTPAAHAPGAACVTIYQKNIPTFTFTGDFEVPRRLVLKKDMPPHTKSLMFDSTFCAFLRCPSVFRSILATSTAFSNLPSLHPQSAEGVSQETSARLNLFIRKLNSQRTIQVDSVHALPVNMIVRKGNEYTNFGDILSGVDSMQSFRQQAVVSVPTSIHSGSTAAQFAILCGVPSFMMIYDFCFYGDCFRLGSGLIKAYQIGSKIIQSQMRHFQMWCDQHLDYRDILCLIDCCMPKVVYFQHALRINEVNDSAWLVGQLLPFLTVLVFNKEEFSQNKALNYKNIIHREKFSVSLFVILDMFESYGIIMDKINENLFQCGKIFLYTQDKFSILSYTSDMEIQKIVSSLKQL
ncbi:Metallo-beta lactamase family protein [Spironucleus salmonicida]|uniref:Metallo-beta lactamase family protein n=1 Tax=Spironucleus salmonicida TaxID=348837 RepID=V6LDH0_9EUKA|nr:Metallo-beta lactamase family protein [Spironucleus salmonicida]|eukprot:EST41711.1 Metallo-beta lactamase family protein [Spironucleus salmonicida]